MDIQNIQALSALLRALEFSSEMDEKLLWHACFRQKEFYVKEQKAFGNDLMSYQVLFNENKANGKLICMHFDASLRKEIQLEPATVNGVNIQKLDDEMKAIDWKDASEFRSASEFNLSDRESWKSQAAIEKVLIHLEELAATAEGAIITDTLKYKYWIDLPLETMIPNLYHQRSKFEFNQRFYIIGEEGITAIEAFRFLNNRWMQRQALLQRRTDETMNNEHKQSFVVPKSKKNKKLSTKAK